MHCDATVAWCSRMAARMHLDPTTTGRLLGCAALHEIGMVTLSDNVLRGTAPLSALERRAMLRHPVIGADLLAAIPALAALAPGVRWHHERVDGAGYPDRLRGAEIPVEARVLAVADGFHAMIAGRAYRQPRTQREAIAELRAGAGTQWDADIVDVFLDLLTARNA